jgi:hypothetical protein
VTSLLLVATLTATSSFAFAQGRPEARAVLIETAPIIDGRLGDPAWLDAPVFGDFVERQPTLSAVPPVKTTFKIVLDAKAIYFAIRCFDDQAGEIQARARSRDSDAIFRDDAISVKVDATLDGRTTLGFVLNPNGAKLDYRAIDDVTFGTEFDTRWEGAAAIDDEGWTAELRIPYSSLGIDASHPPARIGLNFSRDHARRNATYDWAILAPPFSPVTASRYGSMVGLGALSKVVGESSTTTLEVIPYALTGLRRVQGESTDLDDETLLNGGVDIKTKVGGVHGHVTINTDFAQVDLDNQVVNLTRFGLFQPEKRDFFLEDFEVFNFGRVQQAQMLYSRRLGLSDDGELPILAGTKVVGRASKDVRYGLLQVTTRPRDGAPWTSNTAGRVLYELGGGSNAGVMMTHRQSLDESNDRNLMLGFDATWRGREVPLVLSTFTMGSVTGAEAGEPQTATGGNGAPTDNRLASGGGASLAYKHQLVQPSINYAYYQPELRGDLGFFERTGVQRGDGGLNIEPRIDAGGLSKLEFGGTGTVLSDERATQLLDWRATGYSELYWDAGYRVGVFVTHRFETVLGPFPVGRETEITAGEYNMWVASIEASTPQAYALSAQTMLTGRDYYGGTLLEASLSTSWAPAALVRFDVGGLYDHVTFDDLPDFQSLVINGRVNFGFTKTIGLRLFGGYNLLSDVVQIQSRLRWIYAAGSDLFVVQQVNLDDDAWTPTNVSLVAKTSFRWSLL